MNPSHEPNIQVVLQVTETGPHPNKGRKKEDANLADYKCCNSSILYISSLSLLVRQSNRTSDLLQSLTTLSLSNVFQPG